MCVFVMDYTDASWREKATLRYLFKMLDTVGPDKNSEHCSSVSSSAELNMNLHISPVCTCMQAFARGCKTYMYI